MDGTAERRKKTEEESQDPEKPQAKGTPGSEGVKKSSVLEGSLKTHRLPDGGKSARCCVSVPAVDSVPNLAVMHAAVAAVVNRDTLASIAVVNRDALACDRESTPATIAENADRDALVCDRENTPATIAENADRDTLACNVDRNTTLAATVDDGDRSVDRESTLACNVDDGDRSVDREITIATIVDDSDRDVVTGLSTDDGGRGANNINCLSSNEYNCIRSVLTEVDLRNTECSSVSAGTALDVSSAPRVLNLAHSRTPSAP